MNIDAIGNVWAIIAVGGLLTLKGVWTYLLSVRKQLSCDFNLPHHEIFSLDFCYHCDCKLSAV